MNKKTFNYSPEKMKIISCFPTSNPMHFISVVDFDGKEQILLNSVDEVDSTTASLLSSVITEGQERVFKILRVIKVKEEYELRTFKVQTQYGPKFFQTKIDQFPDRLASDEYLFTDLFGDKYKLRKSWQVKGLEKCDSLLL